MANLNMTALGNNDGVSSLMCVVNNSTDGVLMIGFLIAIFFIMILVLKKYDFDKALLVGSWSCFLVAAIGAAVKCGDGSVFLSPYIALVFLVIAAFTALYVWSTDS